MVLFWIFCFMSIKSSVKLDSFLFLVCFYSNVQQLWHFFIINFGMLKPPSVFYPAYCAKEFGDVVHGTIVVVCRGVGEDGLCFCLFVFVFFMILSTNFESFIPCIVGTPLIEEHIYLVFVKDMCGRRYPYKSLIFQIDWLFFDTPTCLQYSHRI